MSYKIKDFLKRVRVPVHIEDDVEYQLVTIKVNHKGVVPRTLKKGIDIGSKTMYRVSEGQFILSGIDARHGAFGIVPKELEGAVVTNDFWYFEYDETIISKEYFLYFTSTPLFSNVCRIASEGTTNRVRLQASKFFDYEVWLPPVSEQKKLIEVVMKKEVELNTLQTELKTQSNLLSKLRQAYLQEAVMGKLSEPRLSGLKDDKILDEKILSSFNPSGATFRNHSPDKETGKALLKAIKAQKAELIKQGKLRKEKPLPPIKPEEIPFKIPDNWVWCRLGEIGILERGKSKHRPRNDESLFKDGKFPFIQTGDVAQSKKTGYKILSNSGYYNDFGLSQSKMWEKGTLCITIAANIAETGFLTFDACFPDSVVAFSSIEGGDILSNFVKYFIEVSKTEIERFAPATAQKNINLGILDDLFFPLPPLSEQKAIVEKVEGLLATVSLLEEENKIQQKEVQRLMGAVLQEAFGGSI